MRCIAVIKARIHRPGSRGGKFYYDRLGNVVYGERPNHADTHHAAPQYDLKQFYDEVNDYQSVFEYDGIHEVEHLATMHKHQWEYLRRLKDLKAKGAVGKEVDQIEEWLDRVAGSVANHIDVDYPTFNAAELKKAAKLAKIDGWQWSSKGTLMTALVPAPHELEKAEAVLEELKRKKKEHQERHKGRSRKPVPPPEPEIPKIDDTLDQHLRSHRPTDGELKHAWDSHLRGKFSAANRDNIDASISETNQDHVAEAFIGAYGDPSERKGIQYAEAADVLQNLVLRNQEFRDYISPSGSTWAPYQEKVQHVEATRKWQETVRGLRQHRMTPEQTDALKESIINEAIRTDRIKFVYGNKKREKNAAEYMSALKDRLMHHSTADLMTVLHNPGTEGLIVELNSRQPQTINGSCGRSKTTKPEGRLGPEGRRTNRAWEYITIYRKHADDPKGVDSQLMTHEFTHAIDHCQADLGRNLELVDFYSLQLHHPSAEMLAVNRKVATRVEGVAYHPAVDRVLENPDFVRMAGKYAAKSYPSIKGEDTVLLNDGYIFRTYNKGAVGSEFSTRIVESVVRMMSKSKIPSSTSIVSPGLVASEYWKPEDVSTSLFKDKAEAEEHRTTRAASKNKAIDLSRAMLETGARFLSEAYLPTAPVVPDED